MSTKSTKTKTPADIARERRDEIQASLEQVRTFRAGEQAKVEKIDGDRAAGKLGTDYTGRSTAVANMADADDQEQYLMELLGVAEQNLASFILTDSVGGLDAQRQALGVKRAETEETMRNALTEYAEAVSAYNAELTEHIGAARKAGLIEGEADPTLPVLMGGGEYGHPRRLVIEGEPFTVLSTNTDPLVRSFLRAESNSIGGSL